MTTTSAASSITEASTPPALEANRVTKRYRRNGIWALREVDVRIDPGTITALVGPNGAGKSTLLRCFIGFERPTAGSVRLLGIDPITHHADAIREVGYVSQSTGLYLGLSVGDHLELAETLRRRFDRAVATERLDQLGIRMGQRAGELSGGQQAHLALSIAVATRAPVLILDEPLASLDPLARHEFLQVLATDVASRGATALLSSHIVSDVESVCDHLVVLGAGRVMLHTTIAEARQTHRVAPPGGDEMDVVGAFTRSGDGLRSLTRSQDPGLPTPTLEEVVMGYLAASRGTETPRGGVPR